MKALLIFDNFSDLAYSRYCTQFSDHVKRVATTQGLIQPESSEPGSGGHAINSDVLVQMFSPIVASQRFMKEQLSNSYSSIQCEDGSNIVFQDHMGFFFMRVGTEAISFLQREIQVCLTVMTYICGPNFGVLKTSGTLRDELTNLLISWHSLQAHDQTFLVEAVGQPKKGPAVNSAIIKCLEDISKRLQVHKEGVHNLLFAESQLLSWYSNKTAHSMSPQDILLLGLLCEEHRPRFPNSASYLKDSGASATSVKPPNVLSSKLVFLRHASHLVPYWVHVGELRKGVFLTSLTEHHNSKLISMMSSLIELLVDFRDSRREEHRDKNYFDVIDSIARTILDMLRKRKETNIVNELTSKWNLFVRGAYLYFKSQNSMNLQPTPVIETLVDIFRLHCNPNEASNTPCFKVVSNVWEKLRKKSVDSWKAITELSIANFGWNNLELATTSVPIHVFPGLLYYIYIDRCTHIMQYPVLDHNSSKSHAVTKSQVWGMIDFARLHLEQGHFSVMWKDSKFSYTYFLWFEDSHGSTVKLKPSSSFPWVSEPYKYLPGLLCGDFYRKLKEHCFSGEAQNEYKCRELFCIYEGSVTSSVAFETSRKLGSEFSISEQMLSMADVI